MAEERVCRERGLEGQFREHTSRQRLYTFNRDAFNTSCLITTDQSPSCLSGSSEAAQAEGGQVVGRSPLGCWVMRA